jgi:integrase
MLTDTVIRAARPRQKAYKLFDERGLFLLVTSAGSRAWRFKYRYGGREKLLSLGLYPDVGLASARDQRDTLRKKIAAGTDPSAERQAKRIAHGHTFAAVGREWLRAHERKLSPETLRMLELRLEQFVFPYLGKTPIADVTAPQLLAALRRIEARGRLETAHRVRALVGRIMRYAIATGRAERDIAADLRGALAPAKVQHFASIVNPGRVGGLLRALDAYEGQPGVQAALKLAPLVFVRPGELRAAEWEEFDLEHAIWRIPAARMKMGEIHLVPLSRQAIAILEELWPLTGAGTYLFPSLRSPDRPISDNSLNAALRRLGYSKEEQTTHGFRSMASTLLNEQGYAPDLIELQLAHKERNKVRSAYNRAERLEERRQMMQAWADYLDGLKAGGKIIAIKRAAK